MPYVRCEGRVTVYNEGEDPQPLPRHFDVVIERDSEGYYVASVPQIPGCHSQARSLDEVTERIREAIALCLEVEGAPEEELEFVGIQRVTIAA
jgi:predicted RNase H-like HicB family nuclease